jgi:predicted transcriptional regulator
MRYPLSSEPEIIRAMYVLHRNPLGRRTFAEETGLTEAKARTLLEELDSEGLIETSTKGYLVTGNGMRIYGYALDSVKSIKEVPELGGLTTIGKRHVVALLDRNLGTSLESDLWKLRDGAVRAGADGAVILVYDGSLKTFKMPDFTEEECRRYKDDMEKVRRNFERIGNGDLAVIVSGNSIYDAENGLWAVIHALSDRQKSAMRLSD